MGWGGWACVAERRWTRCKEADHTFHVSHPTEPPIRERRHVCGVAARPVHARQKGVHGPRGTCVYGCSCFAIRSA